MFQSLGRNACKNIGTNILDPFLNLCLNMISVNISIGIMISNKNRKTFFPTNLTFKTVFYDISFTLLLFKNNWGNQPFCLFFYFLSFFFSLEGSSYKKDQSSHRLFILLSQLLKSKYVTLWLINKSNFKKKKQYIIIWLCCLGPLKYNISWWGRMVKWSFHDTCEVIDIGKSYSPTIPLRTSMI